jgi:hypothetical protein
LLFPLTYAQISSSAPYSRTLILLNFTENYTHSIFIPQCQRQIFTATQNTRQSYNSVYVDIYIFW